MAALSPSDHYKALFSGDAPGPFRPSFSRKPNLAREFIKLESETPASSGSVRFVLNGRGDVATEMVLELDTVVVGPSVSSSVRPLGERLTERATLSVGGLVVDRYDRDFSKAYDCFFRSDEERRAFAESSSRELEYSEERGPGDEETIRVPLLFAPCRDDRSGVPLAALDDEVSVEVELAEVDGFRVSGARLLVMYAYLDAGERAFFERNPLLYKIGCVQTNEFDLPAGATELNARLSFQGAVECILWVFDGWVGREEALDAASLSVGGAQRFERMPAKWWRQLCQRGFPNHAPKFSNAYAMPFVSRPCDPGSGDGLTVFAGLERVDLRLELSSPAPEGSSVKVYGVSSNLLGVRNGRSRLLFGEISNDL